MSYSWNDLCWSATPGEENNVVHLSQCGLVESKVFRERFVILQICLILNKVCAVSGSSEQHGGSATINMNVNLVTPDKVSASTRRRYETQV